MRIFVPFEVNSEPARCPMNTNNCSPRHQKKTQPPKKLGFCLGDNYLHCEPPIRLFVNGLPISSILKLSMIAESIEWSIRSQ